MMMTDEDAAEQAADQGQEPNEQPEPAKPRRRGVMKPLDEWERLAPSVVAEDEEARKAHFQPFSYTDPIGRIRNACGAPRKNCPNCGFRYTSPDRLCLNCPHCGLDRRCREHQETGKTRCRRHGARQLRGPAHGQYKHGKSSMLWGDKLPSGPKEAFRDALKTMDQRNVYHEMATFQTRINQLSARIAKSSESDAWWVQLGMLEGRARDAAASQDQQLLDQTMNDILKLARKGASEAGQWRELLECVKELANLKQVQGQIEKDHKAYLSMSEAMAVIETMAHAVKEALVLVRDKWRTVEGSLSDPDLMKDLSEVAEADGVDAMMALVEERFSAKSMNLGFKEADRIVQERMQRLIAE